MTNIGLIGICPENGHPYSFSSIINGYDGEIIEKAGWGVIRSYLDAQDTSKIGFPDARVTHVWTQDENHTNWLQQGCHIPNRVKNIQDFVGNVDAVILARDDYDRHAEMALPLLNAGIPVFVDKPLALEVGELRQFQPFLESGQLMSCSGLRYAQELDTPRSEIEDYGTLKLIRGTVVNGWEKYGVHMIEAIYGILSSTPASVLSHDTTHDSFLITMHDGTSVQIDALGNVPITLQVDIWGTKKKSTHSIRDNFTAFRRTLRKFLEMVKTRTPQIEPSDTMQVMKTLVAGRRSKQEGKSVLIEDVKL